jgi:hypothetical protein
VIQVQLVHGAGVADPAEPVCRLYLCRGLCLCLGLCFADPVASGSLTPPGPKNLIPLSAAGLWLAEMTTPKDAFSAPVR